MKNDFIELLRFINSTPEYWIKIDYSKKTEEMQLNVVSKKWSIKILWMNGSGRIWTSRGDYFAYNLVIYEVGDVLFQKHSKSHKDVNKVISIILSYLKTDNEYLKLLREKKLERIIQ